MKGRATAKLRKSLRRSQYKSHIELDRARLAAMGNEAARLIREQVERGQNMYGSALPSDHRATGRMLESLGVIRIRNTHKKVQLDIAPSRARHIGSGISNIKLGFILHHGRKPYASGKGAIKGSDWLGLNKRGIDALNRQVEKERVIKTKPGPPPPSS